MTVCNHSKLILLPEPPVRLKCRHCHLTISADELGGSDCPECFEKYGLKRYDFEEIAVPEAANSRYRCEECGAIINSD